MKICVLGLDLSIRKHSVKDVRLDQLHQLVSAKKKTYVQVEIVPQQDLKDADCLLVNEDFRLELILKDLEFVETRLSRATEDKEIQLLKRLKEALEQEKFASNLSFSCEEKALISTYGLVTSKPIVVVSKDTAVEPDVLLAQALKESGYISFFTLGDKENRAWLIKKGTTALEAAGCIHSDIQRGFIRAEIIAFEDFIKTKGESEAKRQGFMRLEPKEYIMQDADIVNFRFNK